MDTHGRGSAAFIHGFATPQSIPKWREADIVGKLHPLPLLRAALRHGVLIPQRLSGLLWGTVARFPSGVVSSGQSGPQVRSLARVGKNVRAKSPNSRLNSSLGLDQPLVGICVLPTDHKSLCLSFTAVSSHLSSVDISDVWFLPSVAWIALRVVAVVHVPGPDRSEAIFWFLTPLWNSIILYGQGGDSVVGSVLERAAQH